MQGGRVHVFGRRKESEEEDQLLQTGRKAGTSLALQGEAAVAARMETTSPPAPRGWGQVTLPTLPQGEAGPEPRVN